MWPACNRQGCYCRLRTLTCAALLVMQKAEIAGLASAVFKLTDKHSSEFLPVGTAYIQAEKLKKALQEHSAA